MGIGGGLGRAQSAGARPDREELRRGRQVAREEAWGNMRTCPQPLLRVLLAGRHLGLAAFLLVLASGGVAWGQSPVVVQFINGRSGKPIAKAKVYIGFDGLKTEKSLALTTDSRGEVRFNTEGAKTFQVHPVALVACGEQPKGAPYRNYSIAEILQTGLVTLNDCGHEKAEPTRGRLIYFARPAGWWELFKN